MSIQMKEALELRKRWKEIGNKPCDHPGELVKEYDLGTATGDYVCSKCGEPFWNGEKEKPTQN